MANKWIEVPKIMFNGFNEKRKVMVINHRQGWKYYGNASNVAISKKNEKEGKYFIMYNELIKVNPVAEMILKDYPNMM